MQQLHRLACSGDVPSCLLFFPPAMAHASSVIGRELYLGFEPLAVGGRPLTRPGFERLLRLGRGVPPGAAQADGAWDLECLVEKVVGVGARARPGPTPSACPVLLQPKRDFLTAG